MKIPFKVEMDWDGVTISPETEEATLWLKRHLPESKLLCGQVHVTDLTVISLLKAVYVYS